MDPLSNVLSVLGARSFLSAQLTAHGDWSIRFAETVGIKFNAVLRGTCWLRHTGTRKPIRLRAGDGFLFAPGHSYVLASDLERSPIQARTVFAKAIDGHAHHGDEADGGTVSIVGGQVTLDATADASLLLDVLPPLFRVAAGSPEAEAIAWLVTRLSRESTGAEPGSALASEHLAHLLFLEFLRAYVSSASHERPQTGWLAALADPRLAKVLQCVHLEPARRWTLSELARHAGMSRSGFALQWKRVVGTAPIDYLLAWRMLLAKKTLRTGRDSVAQIAISLGYESESAFSNAFKRVVGKAPMHYRQSLAEQLVRI